MSLAESFHSHSVVHHFGGPNGTCSTTSPQNINICHILQKETSPNLQFYALVGAQQVAEAAQLRAHEAEQNLIVVKEAAAQGSAAAGGSEARERAALLRAAAVARRVAERSAEDLRVSEANSAASASKWSQNQVTAVYLAQIYAAWHVHDICPSHLTARSWALHEALDEARHVVLPWAEWFWGIYRTG